MLEDPLEGSPRNIGVRKNTGRYETKQLHVISIPICLRLPQEVQELKLPSFQTQLNKTLHVYETTVRTSGVTAWISYRTFSRNSTRVLVHQV